MTDMNDDVSRLRPNGSASRQVPETAPASMSQENCYGVPSHHHRRHRNRSRYGMTSTIRIVVGSTNTTRFCATVYLTPFASGAVASTLSGKKYSSVAGGTSAPTDA